MNEFGALSRQMFGGMEQNILSDGGDCGMATGNLIVSVAS